MEGPVFDCVGVGEFPASILVTVTNGNSFK